MDSAALREKLKDKKRIVIKVGTSSLTHPETGSMDLITLEKLVRELTDLHNRGKEVILVSSGAIAVGRKTVGMKERPTKLSTKQGLRVYWTGTSYDDLSETFYGIQSGGITDSDDQEYAGKWGEPSQRQKYI